MNARLNIVLGTSLTFAMLFLFAIYKLVAGGDVAGPETAAPWVLASAPFGAVAAILIGLDMLRAAFGLEPRFL